MAKFNFLPLILYAFGAVFILSVHHSVRDNLEDSVITAAAAGGAMGGLLDVLEDVEEAFDLGVLFECVEYIEVGYVFAVADSEVGCRAGVNGLEVAGLVFVCHRFILREFLLMALLYHIRRMISVI